MNRTNYLALLISFFCLFIFATGLAQSHKDVVDENWKSVKIGKSDMEIQFPGEPQYTLNDTLKIIEQYSYRFGTVNQNEANFMYFISVVKYNTVINIDSATFINASTMILNSQLQKVISIS